MSVSRAGESRQLTQSPRLRRHAVPQRGQASGSSCPGIEIELPLIGMLNAEDYKLTTARTDELDPAAWPQSSSLCFSGIWRAKFSKMLRLACGSRGIYTEIFGFL